MEMMTMMTTKMMASRGPASLAAFVVASSVLVY
jgi:hypothetical protein